jgi:O-antigen ligase
MISHKKPLEFAYLLLLLFMMVYYARPEDWSPSLHYLPLAMITGSLVTVALLFRLSSHHHRLPREVIYLILLIVQLWVTVPMSPVWRGGAFTTMRNFTKVLPIIMAIALLVDTIKKLRWLILVQTVSVTMIAAVTIWKGHQLGGRLEGAIGGIYGNSNDLAFAIAISWPLCLYFLFRSRNKLWKSTWALGMLVMVYAIFMTASRSGLISLTSGILMCLWQFAIRGRRRYLSVAAVTIGIIFWAYGGKRVISRFDATAQSTNPEQVSAYGSTQERWALLIQSLKVTARHPLFGIGPGNFEIVSGHWRVTHNSYTQVSSEGGIIAGVLYMMIIGRGFGNLLATKRMSKPAEEARTLASALLASLVAFACGSFFASEAYQFFPYFFVAYTTALYKISARKAVEERRRRVAEANQGGFQEMLDDSRITEAEADPING